MLTLENGHITIHLIIIFFKTNHHNHANNSQFSGRENSDNSGGNVFIPVTLDQLTKKMSCLDSFTDLFVILQIEAIMSVFYALSCCSGLYQNATSIMQLLIIKNVYKSILRIFFTNLFFC